ncbi:MAG: HEAT repeat domain-containing protein [Myxococcales bacterium]|nr:HEAT repeat domain-containing protein [Myxococcales bacterium]
MRAVALTMVAFCLAGGQVATARAQAIPSGPVAPFSTGETLLDRTAVARGRELLYGSTEEERRRGVERLASTGTPQAVDALLEALETGSVVARDPAARLLAVRLLAPLASREDVRKLLVRELHDAGGRRDPALRIASLLRETAALALARAGDEESLQALVSAAAQRGPAGEAARAALVIAPPVALSSILYEPPPDESEDPDAAMEAEPDPFPAEERPGTARPRKPKAKPDRPIAREAPDKRAPAGPRTPRALLPPLLTLLGDLGDVRALPALRNEVGSPHRPSRAAAAVSLAKLGDASIGAEVLPWLEDAEPRVVLAAAEALVIVGHPKAPQAVAKALRDEASRSAALALAHDLADPSLRAQLLALLPKLEGEDAVRAVMALGRAGDVTSVAGLFEDAGLAPAAISALGAMPSEDAEKAIERGLGEAKPPRRRAFVRAAIVRGLVLADAPDALASTLAQLGRSKDPSDREVAAFGRVALGLESAEAVLATAADLPVVSGAARAALLRDEGSLAAFAPLLVDVDPEAPKPVAIAAGVALLSRDVADRVPFKSLLRLAENGGPIAALAARALPRRDDGTARERVRALLAGTDASVRAAVALGFGEAEEASSVSVLASRYHQEEDPRVRRAVVRALAMRSEPQRKAVLLIAARTDPDAEVRRVAEQALRGKRVEAPRPLVAGTAALFRVDTAAALSEPPALRLVLPSGLALAVFPAADGALLVGGMPFGGATLELAEDLSFAKGSEDK